MCQEKKGPWRSQKKLTISAWNVKSFWQTYNMATDKFVSALLLLLVTSYKCQWLELAVLTLNGQDLSHSQSNSHLNLSVWRTRLICISFKPESKILSLMEMGKERILNSSTARCLWIAEKYKEAKFIKLKYYYISLSKIKWTSKRCWWTTT